MNKEKLIERFLVTFAGTLTIGILIFVPYCIFLNLTNTKPDKTSITKCTNIKKLYKDDILFDNFYIACDENVNLQINPELYTRIVEGENYIVTFNNLGGLYSIEKEGKE